MIKFFKKIRQNLLLENKTGKYLKYAVGEIVLVVIGILIALSINNWNENRKERRIELKILQEIGNNLESDTLDFKAAIRNLKFYETNNRIILEHLTNKTPLVDSLKFHYANLLGGGGTSFTTIGLENLKSEGVRIIKNDSLKSDIIGLYKQLESMKNWNDVFSVMTEKYQIMSVGRIKVVDTYKLAEPFDLNALQNDNEYQEVIKWNISKLEISGVDYKNGFEALKKTIASIQTEINERK